MVYFDLPKNILHKYIICISHVEKVKTIIALYIINYILSIYIAIYAI